MKPINLRAALTVAGLAGFSLLVSVAGVGAEPKSAAHSKAAAKVAKAASGPCPVNAANKDGYSGPPVLEPGKFFGEAAMGYASAQAAPQVMSKLFCYCGCDTTDGHSALIDCYTSMHGQDCHICQEE